MNRTFRLLALAAALPLTLSACNTGGNTGDTNVESGAAKKMEENAPQQPANGDSLAAGIARDTTNRPTGKEQFDNAAKSRDRDHDGLADEPGQKK
jgi:predicted small secreted protein